MATRVRSTSTKPARSFNCRKADGVLIVTIKVAGQPDATYDVRPIEGSPGIAYSFTKQGDSNEYAVLVEPAEGIKTCECLGFLRWNYCRHSDCLEALFSHGRLAN